jgi:ATP-dependent DNA helicase RecG
LFGRNPRKFLPQSGIRAVSYRTNEPSYETIEDTAIGGPLVSVRDADGTVISAGVVEQALDFLHRVVSGNSELSHGRREDTRGLPDDVAREVVVNALAHRDYSIGGSDVLLEAYPDRIVVTSPGRLPNSATVDGVLEGFRYARNQTLVNVLRDYGYVDFRGMGIRAKVVPGMRAFNGSEPSLQEGDQFFRVTLSLG